MFLGAQVSLYPMTSDFVTVIMSGLDAISPNRDKLRIEIDDISSLMLGAPDPLIDAIRDLFSSAARHPDHVRIHVNLSRGCPTRTSEGNSLREIRRCLKRYVAREIFAQLREKQLPECTRSQNLLTDIGTVSPRRRAS